MITLKSGDILKSNTEAIINSVNTVGVMGKGLALAFKTAYPENFIAYKKVCANNEFQIGKLFVTETGLLYPKYLINFPTKIHWRNPSKYEYDEKGLIELKRVINEKNIHSISIPPLGCGNGKLDWNHIKLMIDSTLSDLSDINILLFEPTYIYKKKTITDKPHLTAVRAILLKLLKEYLVLDDDLVLIVAQKLSYFIQRLGETSFNLKFEKGYYGAYSNGLAHLLKALNGYFIIFDEENNSPFTSIDIIYDNYSEVEDYISNNLTQEQTSRLNIAYKLIDGFQTAFGIELLSTVDYILKNNPSFNLNAIINNIQNWTKRKKQLMKPEYIEIAYNRLQQFKDILYV